MHLVFITPELAKRIVDRAPLRGDRWHPEYPLADELDVLRPLADETDPDPVFGPMMILDAAGLAVGGIGFFGPPDAEGSVEIGYGLVPAARGQGLATAAVEEAAKIGAANGAKRLTASTDPANLPSSRVLERAGFRELPPNDGLRQFERLLAS